MRALGAQLLKGERLARLVGKARPSLRVGKQMLETVAQHHRQHIKHDLTIADGTALLELPPTTFHLFVVLFDLGALFVVAHNPWGAQAQSGCDQDDMIRTLFLLIPEANHTGVQRHRTLCPPMLHPRAFS